jgi:4-carboxymuconolactone decarboxylase
MSPLNHRERELVAIGAAIASNCVPCIRHHVPEARRAGLDDAEIDQATRIADVVRRVPAREVLRAAREGLGNRADESPGAVGAACGCGRPATST